MRGWGVFCGLLLAAILVPFALFGDGLEAATRRLLADAPSPWRCALLLGGLLASDIVLPVPSSLVSTAAGAMLGFWRGLATSWVGMMVSCQVGYVLGARAGGTTLRRVAGEAELARVARASERHGHWFLLLFRGVPVLAEASVVFAGLGRMPPRRFLSVCALSNLGCSASYAALGALAMETGSFLLLFTGMVLLPALALALVRGTRGG
ncbi:TVP38/TMEM64 family protein [Archangium lipolyticum]|uniref:TVP38/TMEM64 family protein n=1 Tax=Archangium lipolyticum TaxID=2970465 RepID=UPI00214A18E2|nr:VTT domain-containing protein [Archangium lipolyticum]